MHLATVGAIALGGYWFLKEERNLPKLNCSISLKERHVANTRVLFATVSITNVGTVPVELSSLKYRIQKISPVVKLPDRRDRDGTFAWLEETFTPVPADVKLAPNETDQIEFEYILPKDVSIIKVYTELYKKDGDQRIWHLSRLYDTIKK